LRKEKNTIKLRGIKKSEKKLKINKKKINMKKILITIIFMHTLTAGSISAEIKDCSVYSKFNPKFLACKTANFVKDSVNYQKKAYSKKIK